MELLLEPKGGGGGEKKKALIIGFIKTPKSVCRIKTKRKMAATRISPT